MRNKVEEAREMSRRGRERDRARTCAALGPGMDHVSKVEYDQGPVGSSRSAGLIILMRNIPEILDS
jgi:hypothetical protein